MKLLLFALALPVFGQNLGINLACPAQATAGVQTTCTISTTGTATPAGVVGILSISTGSGPSSTPVAWTITTPLTSKQVYNSAGSFNVFVIIGPNQVIIPAGQIASVSFTMPSGSVSYSISSGAAVDASGGVITVGLSPLGTILVQSKCDENGDGVINAADVAIGAQAIVTSGATISPLVAALGNVQKDAAAIITGVCTR